MRYLSTDIIFPVDSAPIFNGALILNEDSSIKDICTQDELPKDVEVEHYKGALCPGFINSHCHLELSHIKGLLPKKTGMAGFIKNLLSTRSNFNKTDLLGAAMLAETKMLEEGIVGVGDISNDSTTFTLKGEHKLRYHTFIEVFDLEEGKAMPVYQSADRMCKEYIEKGFSCSIVPHAPYTVSKKLFNYISSQKDETLISYHNQESKDEQELFEQHEGKLLNLFEGLGVRLNYAKGGECISSAKQTLINISQKHKLLLVHNTYTSKEDVQFIHDRFSDVYFCLCPHANLYIENKLPDISMLRERGCNLVVGTDSLASNDQLSVLEELKVISKYFPEIPLEELLQWGTINAANYFNWESELGSFSKGKTPGVVHISNIENGKLTIASRAKRVA